MVVRIRVTHLAAALIVLVAMIVTAQTSFAQPVFTNPPCPGVKVRNNNLTCTAQVRLVTVPPGVWPALITLAPGTGFGLPMPVASVTVTGMTDVFGTFFPFNAPPPPITGCGPGAWWISGIFLAPALGCSFNVCADPSTCSITLY